MKVGATVCREPAGLLQEERKGNCIARAPAWGSSEVPLRDQELTGGAGGLTDMLQPLSCWLK